MAQRYRIDYPGAWHHIVNRGVARRPIFPTAKLSSLFLDLLAAEVAAGWIEIHAYSLLSTHFHLLTRSPRGEVFRALMRAQNVFARTFNRENRRDGPLFRGRYHASHVTAETHWRCIVSYIDFNAVGAGIVEAPELHRFGSASAYAGHESVPWLRTDVVQGVALEDSPDETDAAAAYRRVFGRGLAPAERHCVESRLRHGRRPDGDLDDLVGAAPAAVRDWMQRKSRLADAGAPSRPVVSADTVTQAVAAASAEDGDRAVDVCGVRRVAWRYLHAGLLRVAACCAWREIASRLGVSVAGAHGLGEAHGRLLSKEPTYVALAASVLERALAADWPGAVPRAYRRTMFAAAGPAEARRALPV